MRSGRSTLILVIVFLGLLGWYVYDSRREPGPVADHHLVTVAQRRDHGGSVHVGQPQPEQTRGGGLPRLLPERHTNVLPLRHHMHHTARSRSYSSSPQDG